MQDNANGRHAWGTAVAALALGALLAAGCEDGSAKSHKKHSAAAATPSAAWTTPVGAPLQGLTLYDGWQDPREVPAPVNIAGGWTDSVAVTSDGLHLYFGYTRYDFPTFFMSLKAGGPAVFDPTGPYRPGMTGDKFKIFRADLANGAWAVTYHPVNDPDGNVAQASSSVNAAQDLMVFSEFDGAGDATLWYSTLSGGVWSAPAELPAGSPIAINNNAACPAELGDDNGFVVGNLGSSVTLTWESHRGAADGSSCGGHRHLYQATFDGVGMTWSAIQAVPGLNAAADGTTPNPDDSQVSFSPDGQTAYWTSVRTYLGAQTYGIFTADWDGSSYSNVRLIAKPTYPGPFTGKVVIQGEANVAELPEGWILYMMCGVANSETDGDVTLKVCTMRKPR